MLDARYTIHDTRNPGQQTDNEGVMDGFLRPGRSARLVPRRDTDTSPELRRGGPNTEKLVTAYNYNQVGKSSRKFMFDV